MTYNGHGAVSVYGSGEFDFGSVTNTGSNSGKNLTLTLSANNNQSYMTAMPGYQTTPVTSTVLKVVGALDSVNQQVTYGINSNATLELNNTGAGSFNNTISFNGKNATLTLLNMFKQKRRLEKFYRFGMEKKSG
jgi:hypothetical protein